MGSNRGAHEIHGAGEHLVRVALVAQALTAAVDALDVVEMVVRQGMAGLDADGGLLAVLDPSDVLVPVAMSGPVQATTLALGPLTIDRDLPLTTAARENISVWVSSRAEGERRFPAMLAASPLVQAWAAVPLAIDGSVLGVLGIRFLSARSFSETERLFIRALADIAALTLTTGGLGGALSALTHHTDPPPNRSLDAATLHIIAAARGLAAILNDPDADRAVFMHLVEVNDILDDAIRDCRRVADGSLSFGSRDARAHTNAHLEDALASRAAIDRATGILMARDEVSADEALAELRRRSQNENRDVGALAHEIVATYNGRPKTN
jgi:ANTAR domain/GAF domain